MTTATTTTDNPYCFCQTEEIPKVRAVPDPKQTLLAAMSRIEDPDNWTQESMARDADGKAVESHDPSATEWCALGSLEKEARLEVTAAGNLPDDYDVCEEYLDRASKALYSRAGIIDLNDTSEHATVLSVYLAAAEMFDGERCRACAYKKDNCRCKERA